MADDWRAKLNDPTWRARAEDMDDPEVSGEDALDAIGIENNEGELVIALQHIARVMRERGWSYERAVLQYGIRGHPYFADFWPVTTYWGDARFAREELGLPLGDE